MPRQNLTANACTVCRKKRTKCDGGNPCRRCVSRGEDCVYEDKMWRTKDHLRSEIERLRKEVHQSHGLIKALSPQGADKEWKTIQSRLQRGDSPERIAEWINSLTISHPRSTNQPMLSPEMSGEAMDTSASGTMSPSVTRGSSSSLRGSSSYPRSVHTSDSTVSNRTRLWTRVTQDTEVIHRLLYCYFNRCFPDFTFICKERFMRDFNEGTELYCSHALVNAMLGFASQSRVVVSFSGSQHCSSDQFLCEAKRLLQEQEGQMGITGIQAIGVLAMAEVNLGNDETAYQLSVDCARNTILLKMRMDSEGHDDAMDDQNYREAMAATFCGAFSLIRIFRLLTGRLSTQTGPLFMRLVYTPEHAAEETPEARVERGVALQQHFISQVDYCPEPMRLLYTVTEIAHTFCSYHHDGGVTPPDLIPAYNKCLLAWATFNAWLPRGIETNKEIVFAQIAYNYILLVLFNTLVHVPLDLRDGITPEAVVIKASQSIIYLTGVYQDHCTFESIHPFMPLMVFAATLFQLRRSHARLGDRSQQPAGKAGDKRKRHSEPHTPTPIHSPSHTCRPLEFRRQSSPALNPERFPSPPLESHVAAITLQCATGPNDTEASILWSSKSSYELADHGTQLLTQMGAQYPKAAELANILRLRSMAGPPEISTLSFAKPVDVTTPLWPATLTNPPVTGLTSAPHGVFPGPGLQNIQSFAALTASGIPTMSTQGVSPAGGVFDHGSMASVSTQGVSPAGGVFDHGSMASVSPTTTRDVSSYFDVPVVYPNSAQQPRSGSAFSGYSSRVGSEGMLGGEPYEVNPYAGDVAAGLF